MSRFVRIMYGLLAAALPSAPALAANLQVPTQFVSIQAAIDAAGADDEIIIAPGTYIESLHIINKIITLRGSTAADVIIRPGSAQSIVTIENSSIVRIIGVTLRGGVGEERSLCGGNGRFGGAVLSTDSTVTVEDSVLTENNAEFGGAVFLLGGQFTARRTTFSNNGTAADGISTVGAVYRNCDRTAPAIFVLEDCQVLGNGNPLQLGLDILSPFNGPLTARRTRFAENNGSVLRPFGPSVLDVDTCEFVANRSSGAAISLVAQTPSAQNDIRGSTFTGNQGSTSADIFAALPGEASRLTITGCTFTDADGGSVFITLQPDDAAFIDRCRFTGTAGPAIGFNNDGGRLGFRNVVINRTQSDAIIANATGLPGELTIYNCTIADNLGIGVRTDALLFSNLRIANSIITGNNPRQIGVPIIPGATIEVRNSIVQGGAPGPGNLNLPPAFVDPAANDYRLQPSSPAIDAGDNAFVLDELFGAATLDLAGNPRRADAPQTPDTGLGGAPVIDIGAFEFTPQPICRADLNNDGSLGVQDIFDFLSAYFSGSAAADFNQVGGITVQDIFDFLVAYFAGC